MKTAAASQTLRKALKVGRVQIHPHAAEQIELADVSDEAVYADLEIAADRNAVSRSRNHPDRFIAHGERFNMAFEAEMSPLGVLVITVMIVE